MRPNILESVCVFELCKTKSLNSSVHQDSLLRLGEGRRMLFSAPLCCFEGGLGQEAEFMLKAILVSTLFILHASLCIVHCVSISQGDFISIPWVKAAMLDEFIFRAVWIKFKHVQLFWFLKKEYWILHLFKSTKSWLTGHKSLPLRVFLGLGHSCCWGNIFRVGIARRGGGEISVA